MYKKIVNYLVKWGVDRYLHLLACLTITWGAAWIIAHFSTQGAWTSAGIGMCVGLGAGIVKELVDFFGGSYIDLGDLRFDLTGTLAGGLMFALAACS